MTRARTAGLVVIGILALGRGATAVVGVTGEEGTGTGGEAEDMDIIAVAGAATFGSCVVVDAS